MSSEKVASISRKGSTTSSAHAGTEQIDDQATSNDKDEVAECDDKTKVTDSLQTSAEKHDDAERTPSVESHFEGNDSPSLDKTLNETDPEAGTVGEKNAGGIPNHLSGWRLNGVLIGVMAAAFLGMMEASIVSTALVGITNDLQDYKISSWIVNAYLVTFTGFLLIWVQFSFVTGRRVPLFVAFCIFIAFSGACGGARTTTELVIFRAFQGIGGAGCTNISMAVLSESIPPGTYEKYVAKVVLSYILAWGLGPLIGGAIVTHTTWRWVFWLNIPAACVTVAVLMICIPTGFPHHNDRGWKGDAKNWQKLDWTGAILFLAGAVLLTTALEGGDVSWDWSSATSVCLFVFAILAFIAFTLWQRHASLSKSLVVPLMSWKFANRKTLAMLALYCLTSFPFTASNVFLVERFQIIDGLNAFDAGVRLLPFIVVLPLAGIPAALVAKKLKHYHAYAMMGALLLQLIAIICFVTAVPDVRNGPPCVVYGFEVLLSVGLGINNILLTTIVEVILGPELRTEAVAAGFQLRYLGNTLGLGILTAVFDSRLKSSLSEVLSADQLTAILQSTAAVAQLPLSSQKAVQEVFYLSVFEPALYERLHEDRTRLQWQRLQVQYYEHPNVGESIIVSPEVCNPDSTTCNIDNYNTTRTCIYGGPRLYYTVNSDTYTKIANRLNITVDAVMGTDPGGMSYGNATAEIPAGQFLKIPQCDPSECTIFPTQFSAGVYKDLAEEYGTTVGQIMMLSVTYNYSSLAFTPGEMFPPITIPANCTLKSSNFTVLD